MFAKKENIYPAHISKHNSNRKKQVILLMISNGQKKWHYLAVKQLSALLRGITSKHYGDIYCLNCFPSFRIKPCFNLINKYVKIEIFVAL